MAIYYGWRSLSLSPGKSSVNNKGHVSVHLACHRFVIFFLYIPWWINGGYRIVLPNYLLKEIPNSLGCPVGIGRIPLPFSIYSTINWNINITVNWKISRQLFFWLADWYKTSGLPQDWMMHFVKRKAKVRRNPKLYFFYIKNRLNFCRKIFDVLPNEQVRRQAKGVLLNQIINVWLDLLWITICNGLKKLLVENLIINSY